MELSKGPKTKSWWLKNLLEKGRCHFALKAGLERLVAEGIVETPVFESVTWFLFQMLAAKAGRGNGV